MPAVRPGRFERIFAGIAAVVGCLVFATARSVDPYEASGRPRTHGTHRQLGLQPCTLLSTVGFPCPTCGMTTSISLVTHADLVAAWRANWAGVFVGGSGLVAIVWFGLLACGTPRRPRFSAECTILALTVFGAVVVFLRYMGIVAAAVAAAQG